MVSRPSTNCASNTNRTRMSDRLELARTRGSLRRRYSSINRPIRQRTPKKPPETIASSCLFAVLMTV
ncbi:hypothetical protein D3C84_1247240 [compost metagenome]